MDQPTSERSARPRWQRQGNLDVPLDSDGVIDWDELTRMVYWSHVPIEVKHNLRRTDRVPPNYQMLDDYLLVYPSAAVMDRDDRVRVDYSALLDDPALNYTRSSGPM